MITKLPSAKVILSCVLRLRKAAILPTTMAALAMPYAAQAGCNFDGTLGPGTVQFQGFLTATSSAAISAVTSMNTGFQSQSSAFVFSPNSSQPNQFASGLWGRAVGGRMDTDSVSTGEVSLRPGTQSYTTCATHTRNDYNGFQGGTILGISISERAGVMLISV
jgi:hypothetical protein